MKLELGKKYVTREGTITSPLQLSKRGDKFSAFVEQPGAENDEFLSWTQDGIYFSVYKQNRRDLVAEAEE